MPDAPDLLHELELLVRSRHGLIVLETSDEERADRLLEQLAARLQMFLFEWTRSKGLRRAGEASADRETAEPADALLRVDTDPQPALYHFKALALEHADAVTLARLKDAVHRFQVRRGAVVLSGEAVVLPPALRRLSATLRLPAPSSREYRELMQRVVRDFSARAPVTVDLSPDDATRLLGNLRGLSLTEAERVLSRAILEDGRLHAADIERVAGWKREIVARGGTLDYVGLDGAHEVAGLDTLKAWLAKRRAVLAQPERASRAGLAFPKGVLLIGVPGCGKSLTAKAVAAGWQLPLLRLDASRVYDKFVGESERNFRAALASAERMAPVVLWIDEIEKMFGVPGGEQDGGVSLRIMGALLSWLQERAGDVFVVATANDVTRLPPELVRKGRFDEIFFVDLPDDRQRADILAIHLRRRGHDPARFDLARLAAATAGFSGAELEQAVVSALYTVFAEERELGTEALLGEVAATQPLSRTMAERFAQLREWAKGRTVAA